MLPMMRKIAEDELFTMWLQDMIMMNCMTVDEFYCIMIQSRKPKMYPFYPSGVEAIYKNLSFISGKIR